MSQGLSDRTKSKIKTLLSESNDPPDPSRIQEFIGKIESELTIYVKNLQLQGALPSAGATRRQLAKTHRAAERLKLELEELPPAAREYVRNAFKIIHADVEPFVRAMSFLLTNTTPQGPGRPDNASYFGFCFAVANAYRNELKLVPHSGEGSLFVRVFTAVCEDGAMGEEILNPRDVVRSVIDSLGFEWLRWPIA